MDQQIPERPLRRHEVLKRTGDPRSKNFRDIAAGLFPQGVKQTDARSISWPAAEVSLIIALRAAGASPDELRKAVVQMHAERKKASRRILREFTMARAGGEVAA